MRYLIMKGAGRITDSLTDGDAIAVGSSDVFINNLAASRNGDLTTGHDSYPPSPMIATTGTVYVNNILVLRKGDKNTPHTRTVLPFDTHSGSVVIGSGNVFIGD